MAFTIFQTKSKRTPLIPTPSFNDSSDSDESDYNTAATFIINDSKQKPIIPPVLNASTTSIAVAAAAAAAAAAAVSVPRPPTPPLDEDDLEENEFYKAISVPDYQPMLEQCSVVCVPHSWSIRGAIITQEMIETHMLQPSPYFKEQFVSMNGKLLVVNQEEVKCLHGFKQTRAVKILAEEIMYRGSNMKSKVRWLTIEKPLEGEVTATFHGTVISIPARRDFEEDLKFLSSWPENKEVLDQLKSSVQKFINTYQIIRGYAHFAVDKVKYIYEDALENILNCNATLRDVSRTPIEQEYFMELVENVILGHLHEKIYINSLIPIYTAKDNYLESVQIAYDRDSVSLSSFGVSLRIQQMPLLYLDEAIRCLSRVDMDASDIYLENDESVKLALTPLEKLSCVKKTLDLISIAADQYVMETARSKKQKSASLTSDDLIPLLAFVVSKSQVVHWSSLLFYMEKFRLSGVQRSELSFAFVTLSAAIDFLSSDPLGLYEASSLSSSTSSLSLSSPSVKPMPPDSRQRKISASAASISPLSFSRARSQSTVTDLQLPAPALESGSPPIFSRMGSSRIGSPPTKSFIHRKSPSDLSGVNNVLPKEKVDIQDARRRGSSTPTLVVKPQIVIPALLSDENNRKSLDMQPREWDMPFHTQQKPVIVIPKIGRVQSPSPTSSRGPSLSRSTETTPSSGRLVVASPPEVINVPERISIEAQRPFSPEPRVFKKSLTSSAVGEMGDFLSALQREGDIIGDGKGNIKKRW